MAPSPPGRCSDSDDYNDMPPLLSDSDDDDYNDMPPLLSDSDDDMPALEEDPEPAAGADVESDVEDAPAAGADVEDAPAEGASIEVQHRGHVLLVANKPGRLRYVLLETRNWGQQLPPAGEAEEVD